MIGTAPKAYTPAGNMKSPGYARVVEWIAEAWYELDANVIARSFKYCGITSNNILDYGSQLRHFVQNNESVDDIEETMDDLNFADDDDQ